MSAPIDEVLAWIADDVAFLRDETNQSYCPEVADTLESAAAIIEKLRNIQRPVFDLLQHLERQIGFSERTFGPGERSVGLVNHIRKELVEIEAKPTDLKEWIDVAILALDGAWRCGVTDANPSGTPPEQIIEALVVKQTKNEGRQWPNWRTAEPGKAIEHVRDADESLDTSEREAL